MAVELPQFAFTFTAKASQASNQYKFVELLVNDADDLGDANVELANGAADEAVIGVLQNKPGAGQPATVALEGITKVVAQATIQAGAFVTTHTNGEARTAATTERVYGRALHAASAGELVTVLLLRGAGVKV